MKKTLMKFVAQISLKEGGLFLIQEWLIVFLIRFVTGMRVAKEPCTRGVGESGVLRFADVERRYFALPPAHLNCETVNIPCRSLANPDVNPYKR